MPQAVLFNGRLGTDAVRQHVVQSHELWGGGKGVDERCKALLDRLDAAGPDRLSMAGYLDENGRLLASLKLYVLTLSIEGRQIRTAGLGAIFTEPSARGRGLGAGLVRRILDEAQVKQDCSAALLFSDIGTGFYERLGFAAMPSFSFSRDVADIPDRAGCSSRPCVDAGRLLFWHARAVEGCVLYPVRTPDSFALFSGINGCGGSHLLFHDGREAGYVTVSPGEGETLWIDEWLAPGVNSDAVWSGIARMARERGMKKIAGWWLPWYAGVERQARRKAVAMLARLDGNRIVTDGSVCLAGPDHF